MTLTNRKPIFRGIHSYREFSLQHCCDKCGRPFLYTDKNSLFTIEGRHFKYKEFDLYLTSREIGMMELLARSYPAVVSHEIMFEKLWHPDTEFKIVDVYMCKLRKKLRLTPIRIENEWGVGSRLVIADA